MDYETGKELEGVKERLAVLETKTRVIADKLDIENWQEEIQELQEKTQEEREKQEKAEEALEK